MKTRRFLIICLCILMFAIVMPLSSCGNSNPKDFKVGFVYNAPISDTGVVFAHDSARRALETDLGVTTYYIESVPENQECVDKIDELIKKGCKFIFAASAGYAPYIKELSEKYPKVRFMVFNGTLNAQNIGSYTGKIYQAMYLSGIAAAKATASNKIGMVASRADSVSVRDINAFSLGVASVSEGAKVYVRWVEGAYDPVLEKQAAEELLDAGCDVIAQRVLSSAPYEVSQGADIYSVGFNTVLKSDANNDKYLTGSAWNFAPFYTRVIKACLEGSYIPENYVGSLKDSFVKLDPYGVQVSEETVSLIEDKLDNMLEGGWDVFEGPLYNTAGELMIAAGEIMTKQDVDNMTWFIQNVVEYVP